MLHRPTNSSAGGDSSRSAAARLSALRATSRPALSVAICLALALGAVAGQASAAPPRPDPGNLALTNTAALQQSPVSRVLDEDADNGEVDPVGAPKDHTVVRSDQLMITDRQGGTFGSQRYTMTKLQPDTDPTPAVTQANHYLLDSAYPTSAGRFVTDAADQAIAFQHQGAVDGNALFTLSGLSAAPAEIADPSSLSAGSTYAISMDDPRLPSVMTADVSAVGSGARLASDPAQSAAQWTVVPAEDGSYRLVNLADGQCLDALGASREPGSPVGTYPCTDQAHNQMWKVDGRSLVNLNSGLSLISSPGDRLVQAGPGVRHFLSFTKVSEKGRSPLPTVSFGTDANVETPYDLAVGDLDRAINLDTQGYRDEAAVVWGSDHNINVRVVDYNRSGAPFTVTAPDQSIINAIGGQDGPVYRPGSLNVAVGDFDNDAHNEIAVTWQDASSAFRIAFLRYDTAGEQPKLTVIKGDQPLMGQLKDAPAPRRVAGYADLIAGDFDGSGRDSLALGWVGMKAGIVDGFPTPLLTVARFGDDLSPSAQAWGPLSGDKHAGYWSFIDSTREPVSTDMGVRLAAGVFDASEPNLRVRQIASTTRLIPLTSTANTRQVVVHHVTASRGKLAISGLTNPLYLFDDGGDNPVAIAAGGFRGQGEPDEVPLWGIAVSQSEAGASYVQMVGVPRSGLELERPWRTPNTAGRKQLIPTAYDYPGDSLMLGAPVKFTYENMDRLQMMAAQPPTHSDWIDGKFVNVNRNGEFTVTMSNGNKSGYTSTQKVTNGHIVGVTEESKFDESYGPDMGELLTAKVGIKFGQKMEKEWETEQSTETTTHHDLNVTRSSTTADDDTLQGGTRTTYIYRYPILNQPALRDKEGNPVTDNRFCKTACYASYEVSVPGPVQYGQWDGRSADFFQPTWQNGNALSYPDASTSPVLTSDLGAYDALRKGDPVRFVEPMFDQSTDVGHTLNSVDLEEEDNIDVTSERSSRVSLTDSVFVNPYAKLKTVLEKTTIDVSSSVTDNTTHSNIAIGQAESSASNAFKLEVHPIADGSPYRVRTAYYFDKSGAEKVVHGVELPTSDSWWSTTYGYKPDLALNLPNAISVRKNEISGEFNTLKWNALPDRQKIRGFEALDAHDVGLAKSPAAGDQVQFRVKVHNYSFVDSGESRAQWYAVRVDDHGSPVSEKEAIGEPVRIAGIKARGIDDLRSPMWTAQAGPVGQRWKVFVQLDPTNSLKEIHPLNGTACPEETTTDGKALVDPMTGDEETLACGQNNQGYGTIDVAPNLPGAGASAAPDLAGSTLLDTSGLLSDSPTPVSNVVVGKTVTGLVRATTTGVSRDYQPVMIYDGDPDYGGKGVAATTMQGVPGGSGNTAIFTWTPTTPGTHVLYQRLVGRTAEEGDSVQTLTVNVAAHGEAQSLAVIPSASSTTTGQSVAVTVKSLDAYNNVVSDRTGAVPLSITPDGTCTATACTPSEVGQHTISATDGALTGAATVTVADAVTSSIDPVSGNYQTAEPKVAFAHPLVAKVTDQAGHPRGGQPVTFTVSAGAATFGAVKTASVTTDAAGLATAPTLTAGSSVGPVGVVASNEGKSTLFVAAVSVKPATPADLSVRVKAPATVKVGKTFNVKVKVSNKGPGRAGKTLVSVVVPDRYTIRSDGPGRRKGQFVFYSLESLKKDASKTLTLKLRPRHSGKATIGATVMSTTTDPHRGNNTSAAAIRAKR